MSYKQSSTQCVPCHALRQEAGRLWTELVRLHTDAPSLGIGLSASDLEQTTKGGRHAMHSQSAQALCQQFAANVGTVSALRCQEPAGMGPFQTSYPHHPKPY
jgi:hypothetical protein